jgi:hypothetical protein
MGNKTKIIAGIIAFLLILSGFAYAAATFYANKQAEKKAQEIIKGVSGFVDIKYDKIGVNLLKTDIHLKKAQLTFPDNQKIDIDDITVNRFDYENKIPMTLGLVFNGIYVDVRDYVDNPGDQEELKKMGLERIKTNLEIDYNYDQKLKEFHINTIKNHAEKLGSADFNLVLTNIFFNPDNLMGLLMSYPSINIKEAKFVYNEENLVKILLKEAAKEQNKDVEAVVNEICANIDAEIAKEKDPIARESMENIKKFIKNPQKIQIVIAPEKPVPLKNLGESSQPADILKLLNVKILI